MRLGIVLLTLLLVFEGDIADSSQQQARAELHARLESQFKEAHFVFVGRVSEVKFSGMRATLLFDVHDVLLGELPSKPPQVIMRSPQYVSFRTDDGPSVWLLGERTGVTRRNTTYQEIIAHWPHQSNRERALAIHARLDKQTRIPGMASPQNGDGPISLALGISDGTGGVTQEAELADLRNAWFRLQFENISDKPHTVMPVLDGSVVKWRYPHYEWEIIDNEESPVQRHPIGRCGNVNRWRLEDFYTLESGEVFRTTAPPIWYVYHLPPGRYKARVRYEARQSLETRAIPLGSPQPGVEEAMQGVWEGQLYSNWIELTIVPDEDCDRR